jgi:multidrug efflux pump subunit AcrB
MVSLVGLASDFSLHLSHAYQGSKAVTRALKVRDALLTIGGSVISAAVTTMLSALVLAAGTYVIFFQKFGTFILLTILLSVLWAFLFLMALCAILGRIRPHDDLLWAWRLVTSLCRRHATPREPAPAANGANGHEMLDGQPQGDSRTSTSVHYV